MALDQFDDLDELETRLRRNLEAAVADLLAVLRSDLVTFVEREVRNRFVAAADLAETMEDDQLISLKGKVGELGTRVAKEICDDLSGDMQFWFGPDVPLGEGKSFDAHTPLMDKLQTIAVETGKLLDEYGFPKDGEGYDLRYSPPAYFVNGKYAPGVAETFWKNFAQLKELREERLKHDVGRRRSVRRHRWDVVDKKKS